MIIVSYWIKWEAACDFLNELEEVDANDDALDKVRDQIEGWYQSVAPYGPRADDTVVFASRFERDVMDLIDEMDIPHETRRVETDEDA